ASPERHPSTIPRLLAWWTARTFWNCFASRSITAPVPSRLPSFTRTTSPGIAAFPRARLVRFTRSGRFFSSLKQGTITLRVGPEGPPARAVSAGSMSGLTVSPRGCVGRTGSGREFSASAGNSDDAASEKGQGVDGLPVAVHFEMQMGSPCVAGVAHFRHRLPRIDPLVGTDQQPAGMGVEGAQPVAVIEDHQVSIAALRPHPDHSPGRGCAHRLAKNSVDVDSLMMLPAALGAESGGHHS